MSRIIKALKAIWWILRKPVLLNRVLEDEDAWKAHVQKKYQFDGGLPVIGMDQLFKTDIQSLGPMTFLNGGSLPTDMMLLTGLAEDIKDCRYFEIGTWRGESVAAVAKKATSCHTLCLTDQEMRSMGINENNIKSHMMFSKELENVTQLRGNSKSFDFEGLNQKFDLVFIDGEHHYDVVRQDTIKVFKHLVHEKTIVVWHDYGVHPDQVRYEVLAALLDGLEPEHQGKVYQVTHTKCAIYTGQTFPSQYAESPVIPSEYYHLELTRKKL